MPERDDLLVLLLNGVPIMSYLLLLFITAEAIYATIFDSILMIGSFYLLFQVKDEGNQGPLKFDENLTPSAIILAIALGLATFLGNVAVFSYGASASLLNVARSLALVYTPGLYSVTGIAVFSLVSGILSVFLVSVAEEGLKAVAMFGLYLPMEERNVDTTTAVIVSAGVAIGEWALLHTVRAGFGPLQVGLAFASGVVWFVGWLMTGSIIVPIIAHLEYDSLVLSLAYLSGSLAVDFVVILTVLTMISLVSYIYVKSDED